jgi:hypothetical protein
MVPEEFEADDKSIVKINYDEWKAIVDAIMNQFKIQKQLKYGFIAFASAHANIF